MKITWLVNNINQVGGIEQVVCGLSSYFSDVLHHKVEIVSINTTSSNIYFPLSEAVSVRHCGLNWREQTRKKLRDVVRNVISNMDSHILITCHSDISIAALLNRRFFKGKIIVTQHCACGFESKKRFLLNALIYRFADAFVVLTESDQQIYKKWLCKATVIRNAIFSSIGPRSTLENPILLTAGRLTAVKGFDHLIQAFSVIAKKHPQWKLCICGDGELKQQLLVQAKEAGVGDRVQFPGFVNMSDYMSRAGAFALSSRSEGFSLVLVEAMAHGLPVVAYGLPAINEICGSKGALIAMPNSPESLAEQLDTLFSSKELQYKMSETAYQLSKNYCIESIAQRWQELFQTIVGL